jgi:hypothetical protein
MNVRKVLVAGMQKSMVRIFLKGPGSSLTIVGTLALAGLGAAALNGPAGTAVQQDHSVVAPAIQPTAYGCHWDRDGDGTIKCPASVQIAKLPAAWGACYADLYGDGLTVCDVTER